MKARIFSLKRTELEKILVGAGLKKFRAGQVFNWAYTHLAGAFDEMQNISGADRRRLDELCTLYATMLHSEHLSADGARRAAIMTADGQYVEAAAIPEMERLTFCVSTQIGCPVRCAFCASGSDGFIRNLEPFEMVEQAMWLARIEKRKPTNVVLMGIGEPLHNLENVKTFVSLLNDEHTLNLGIRRFTLSTVVPPAGLGRLIETGLNLNLAISLHSAVQTTRDRLIRPSRTLRLSEIKAEALHYFKATGRNVTFEYVLLDGVNTSRQEAARLAEYVRDVQCMVNLIAFNPHGASEFKRPSEKCVKNFSRTLAASGVNVRIRRSRGLDVAAACGQLRTGLR